MNGPLVLIITERYKVDPCPDKAIQRAQIASGSVNERP
jgi:hypothetical protein